MHGVQRRRVCDAAAGAVLQELHEASARRRTQRDRRHLCAVVRQPHRSGRAVEEGARRRWHARECPARITGSCTAAASTTSTATTGNWCGWARASCRSDERAFGRSGSRREWTVRPLAASLDWRPICQSTDETGRGGTSGPGERSCHPPFGAGHIFCSLVHARRATESARRSGI